MCLFWLLGVLLLAIGVVGFALVIAVSVWDAAKWIRKKFQK